MDSRQKVRALTAAGTSLLLKLGAQVTGLPRTVKGRQLSGGYAHTFARVHYGDHNLLGRPLTAAHGTRKVDVRHGPDVRLQLFAGAVGGLTLLALRFPALLWSQLGLLLISSALLSAGLHLLASIWSARPARSAARQILAVGGCACITVCLAIWLFQTLLAMLLSGA